MRDTIIHGVVFGGVVLYWAIRGDIAEHFWETAHLSGFTVSLCMGDDQTGRNSFRYLHRHQSHFDGLSNSKLRAKNRGDAEANIFSFNEPCPILVENQGSRAFSEDFQKMNAGIEIKDALIAKKLKHWVLIVLSPPDAKGYPAWKARKNYWHLLRRYPHVAARIGLTATSVL